MVKGGMDKGRKGRKDRARYNLEQEKGEVIGRKRGGRERKVKGGERDKLKSFELDPTIRTEVMVKSDFQTVTYISAKL